jgi:hypothetical protein
MLLLAAGAVAPEEIVDVSILPGTVGFCAETKLETGITFCCPDL